MMGELAPPAVRVFATCPDSRSVDRASYRAAVAEAARWCEAAGFEGMLVYAENGLVDPWLVSQLLIDATERLSPLVAVQPVYMHPYSVAKMVASLAHLHGRRTHLNMVAGGFRNDLSALGDETPHDERYVRLTEYANIVKGLVSGTVPVTSESPYYRVRELRMTPLVPPELKPGFMISGSSESGLAAARAIGATAVKYPRPASEEQPVAATGLSTGIRVGIIAREDGDEAWRVAHERFPDDRVGQITHHLAMQVSDSHWHQQLSEMAGDVTERGSPYWLGPFQNYRTFCPYLVGDYQTVADELAGYLIRGFDTFILDIPPSRDELEHSAIAFAKAAEQARR